MKILFAGAGASDSWITGEGAHARMLSQGLSQRGHEIVHEGERRGDLRRAVTATWGKDRDPFSVPRYRRALRRHRPDVVLAFFDYDTSHVRACRLEGVPVVVAIQVYWPICASWTDYIDGEGSCFRPSEERCVAHLRTMNMSSARSRGLYRGMSVRAEELQHATSLVACSGFVKERLEALLPSPPRIDVVPNGVEARPDFPLPEGPPRVLSPTGGTTEYKGYPDFAEVARRLQGQALFVAPGAPPSEGVQGMARLDRPRILEEMERSSFGLMPCRWDEPFGMACAEMQAVGRPMVVTDSGALPEIVEHGRTGLVVARGDLDALTAAVRQLIDDPGLRLKLGREARRRALERFGVQVVVGGFESSLRRAADGQPGSAVGRTI